MDLQKNQISLRDLKIMDVAEISQRIKKDVVLRLCQESTESVGLEILRLWVQKLFKAYDVAGFSTNEWVKLTECLQQSLNNLKTMAEVNMTDIKCWLEDALILLKFVQKAQLNVSSMYYVLNFMLYTINQSIGFHKSGNKSSNFVDYKQNVINLHSLVLEMLNESIDHLYLSDRDDFAKLGQLIMLLSEVGEQNGFSTDIRMTVETWKCVVKLLRLCIKCTPSSKMEMLGIWAARPQKFFIQEIGRNVTVVYKKEALNQPIENIEKYLRVTNFYLTLLLRLVTDFKHERFLEANEFFKTLHIIICMPKYLKHTQIEEILNKYVNKNVNSILHMIYKNTHFLNLLLDHVMCKRKRFDAICFELVSKYLLASIQECDVEFIDNNWFTYATVFGQMIKVATIFISPNKYNEIIECFTALIIISKNTKLKAYFVENVLGADWLTAHASTDILLLASRSSYGLKDKSFINQLHYWRRCNELFAVFSSSFKLLCVQRLLRNYVELHHKHIKTPSLMIPFTCANYRYFLTVGLTTKTSDASSLQAVKHKLSQELVQLMSGFLNGCSVDQYYKMVVYITLLATTSNSVTTELLQKIIELVRTIYEKINLSSSVFWRILDASYMLITAHLGVISENILHSFLECHIIKEIRDLANDILIMMENEERQDKNIMPFLNGGHLETRVYKKTKINIDVYQEILPKLNYGKVKRCLAQYEDDEFSPNKRSRVGAHNNGTTEGELLTNAFLCDILKNCSQIEDVSSTLDNDADRDRLQCILNNLKSLVHNKL